MELTYTPKGDYLLPDLTLPEDTVHIGKYGMLRRTYLKNHKKGMYSSLILSNGLHSHLLEIDQTARVRIERITEQLLAANPAPDKATNQMSWVAHMNSLKAQAEETVLAELVYN